MTLDPAFHYWTLERVAGAIAAGDITSLEATRALLERIEALEPSLHAYATVAPERALAAAEAADGAQAAGRELGPLHGVPIAVKDLCDTQGLRTAGGMRIHASRVPDSDACVVERLEAAGAVILGKLQLTEGAFAAHHPDITVPINPWNAQAWSGISSSGSGAATAAGLCFGSLGSDTGGSIRYPSAANGLVGIKPTYGRVSRRGVIALSETLDHIGPMTRSVRDAALMLAVIAGKDPGDPTCLCASVPDYLSESDGGIAGIRIGIDEAFAYEGVDEGIARAVRSASAELASSGAALKAIDLSWLKDYMQAWGPIAVADIALAHADTFPARATDYGPVLRSFLEGASELRAVDYARAQVARLALSGRIASVFEEVDLILCPSLGLVLPPVPDVFGEGDIFSRFAAPFDLSGSPTISLPCGFLSDGRPVSLQLIGRHLDESLLCRAGRTFERATDWHEQHPPGFA